jgi:5'-nucleotidase
LNNAGVVKKFIFRYLDVPLTDGFRNIFLNITNRDIFNKIIELNKFLSNVCIIRVKQITYSDKIVLMPVILVTNDDGVNSPGLISLFNAVKELGDAYIVAPDRERSAVSHSLTMHRPLNVEKLMEHVYCINGTPTDCVAIGINKILPEKPVLVVSGINKGANLGDDITYSGTVSAAIESTLIGIPSFAISLVIQKKPAAPLHFETASRIAIEIGRYILKNSLPNDTLLNVNVPNVQLNNVKGINFTRQGKRIYDNSIQETYDPHGKKHYWIGGGEPYWEHGKDTDIQAVQAGYISVTPIHLDLTNYEALKFFKRTCSLNIEKSKTASTTEN